MYNYFYDDLNDTEAKIIKSVTPTVYSKLSTIQKEILMDYMFNGAYYKFPKFVAAVITKDY